MSRKTYVPDRGDFVWISLNSTAGHEQSGRRPGLILSPKNYNRKTGLCILCPATRHIKGYAFEVEVANPDGTTSVILSDHLRSLDWRARKIELIRRVEESVLAQAVAKIEALILSPDF